MNADLLQGFYLRDVLIEPARGRVTSRQGSAHLPPKATEVLLCLARRSGELVTHEELLECAWGEGQGSREAVSHAVSEVRHALGDHKDDPDYIQTLPRRGYRLLVTPSPADGDTGTIVLGAKNSISPEELGLFENLKQRGVLETGIAYLILGWLLIQIADIVFGQLLLPQWAGTFVTVLVIAGFPIALILSWFLEIRHGNAVLDELSPRAARRRRFSRTYISVVSALAIAAVAVFVYDQSIGLPVEDSATAVAAGPDPALPPVLENSIAVLPFLNIDGSDATRIFSEGLGEDIIDRLAAVPGLLVSSRGDSWSLPTNAPSELVRKRLRVAYFVEGSVRLENETLRIVVQLIDSERGFHIISRSFERDAADFLELQREITRLIVANLRVGLPEDSLEMFAGEYDDANLDAYVLYRRGMSSLHQPSTRASLDEAIGYFRQSLELDSSYPAAHAGLCQAYVRSYDVASDAVFIGLAESACSAALSVNSKLDVVYTALGDLYERTGRYEDSQIAYERALGINPQSVASMLGLSLVYENQQRFDDAEALLTEATHLQPGNWRSINSLGGFLFAGGRYEEAADAYRSIVALDPDNWQGLGNLGSALLMSGDFEQAATALQRSIQIERDRSNLSNLAIIFYYLGRFDDSVAIHRESVELFPNSDVAWLNLADSLLFSTQANDAESAYRKAASLSESKLAIDPKSPMTLCRAAWANAMIGDPDKGRWYMNQATENAPGNPYVHYYDALLKSRSEDYEAAIDALSIAIANGYPRVMLVAEPHLRGVRESERFQALVTLPSKEKQGSEENNKEN